MKHLSIFALGATIIMVLSACGKNVEYTPATQQMIAMDTVMQFTVYGETGNAVIHSCMKEIQRLEKLLSRTDPFSEIGSLNKASGQPVQVGEETCHLLEAAAAYSSATKGAFDITIAPVMDAWGFSSGNQQIPSQAKLDALLDYVGMEHVHLNGNDTAQLDPGTQVDLGGIAKGYASDCLAEIFAQSGVESGWFSLGGNVLAWGAKPDGSPWLVGIQDPKFPNEPKVAGVIDLKDAYAVTSGVYQRYFEQSGSVYHHILNPSTGYPADSGLTSVTVIANRTGTGSGTTCDALSTALLVMGEASALDFWRNSTCEFELVLITTDNRVLVTSGIAESFAEAEGSGYIYETIS